MTYEREHYKDIKLKEGTKAGKFQTKEWHIYVLDQGMIHLWRIDKKKGFDLRVVKCCRVIGFVYMAFLALNSFFSGDKDAFYPPGTGRVPFTEDLSSSRAGMGGGSPKDVQNVLLGPTVS